MIPKIAVVGATGIVGEEILKILSDDYNFPKENVVAFSSNKSVGAKISFGETSLIVSQSLDTLDKYKFDIAFFCAGSEVSEQYASIFAKSGCVVIDNSSLFRMDEDVPLIIPEINPKEICHYKKKNIIANPNCSTIQMLVALNPLHLLSSIKRIVVSTYQSTSGAGQRGMDELWTQLRAMLFEPHNHDEKKLSSNVFPRKIAFNAIPHIDDFMDDGNTKEEHKMINETQKILDPNINVSATCVRVPTMRAHAESLNVEFSSPITLDNIYHTLSNREEIVLQDQRMEARALGLEIIDNRDKYHTPDECKTSDFVYVSRIREDKSQDNTFNMWIVSDNVRKGAALNAIQIADILSMEYLNKGSINVHRNYH